jgi:hypothetical protein
MVVNVFLVTCSNSIDFSDLQQNCSCAARSLAKILAEDNPQTVQVLLRYIEANYVRSEAARKLPELCSP